jgi:hypothetical protein
MEMCGSDKDIGKSSNREQRAITKKKKSNSDRERTTTYKTRGQCKREEATMLWNNNNDILSFSSRFDFFFLSFLLPNRDLSYVKTRLRIIRNGEAKENADV